MGHRCWIQQTDFMAAFIHTIKEECVQRFKEKSGFNQGRERKYQQRNGNYIFKKTKWKLQS